MILDHHVVELVRAVVMKLSYLSEIKLWMKDKGVSDIVTDSEAQQM